MLHARSWCPPNDDGRMTMEGAELADLIRTHGLAVLAPLALIEGPVITLLTGWLTRLGLLDPLQAFLCLVMADLAGDMLLYAIGRWGRDVLPLRLVRAFGISRARMAGLARVMRDRGGRVLVIGKLTHVAGFAVLLAAGVAGMSPGRFLLANLLATLPKTAVLMGLGWGFGSMAGRLEDGLWLACAAMALALALWLGPRLLRRNGVAA